MPDCIYFTARPVPSAIFRVLNTIIMAHRLAYLKARATRGSLKDSIRPTAQPEALEMGTHRYPQESVLGDSAYIGGRRGADRMIYAEGTLVTEPDLTCANTATERRRLSRYCSPAGRDEPSQEGGAYGGGGSTATGGGCFGVATNR